MAFDQQLFRSSNPWEEYDYTSSSRGNISLDSAESGYLSSISPTVTDVSVQSSHSSGSSSPADFDCASSDSSLYSSLPEDRTDPWSQRLSFPSERYQSSGIMPGFNIWSPCSEDDSTLDSLSSRVTKSEESSETSSVDWGCFISWEHLPTPEEADILDSINAANKKRKEAEAAERRAAKIKARRLHQAAVIRLERIHQHLTREESKGARTGVRVEAESDRNAEKEARTQAFKAVKRRKHRHVARTSSWRAHWH